jgi:AcrR family transcriptional regulator
MSDPSDQIRLAAAQVFAQQGWHPPAWQAVADRAGVPLADVFALYPDVPALLRDWHALADRAMLADLGPDETQGPDHDRLFALLMRRFDALAPFRSALKSLTDTKGGLAFLLVPLAPLMERSMLWALEAGGLSTYPVRDLYRAALLVAADAATFKTWRLDDSEDLGPTMKVLDQQLNHIARMPGFVRRNTGLDAQSGAAA